MSAFENTPYVRLSTLANVYELDEGWPLELWMNGKGRVFVRAYTQSGCCYTHIDVLDLVKALRGSEFEHEPTET